MVKSSIRNQKIVPFEDFLDLATLVKLKKGNYQIGAYLLSKKQVSDTNNTLQLVFGYECTGFHPLFNSSERLEAMAKAFENGCKEFSSGEKFTFRWSSFCDEEKVIESYRQRLDSPVSLESEFLDWGQVARMQELTRNHQRKDIKLSIYTTFTVRPGGTEGGDAVDRAIVKLANFLQRKFTPIFLIVNAVLLMLLLFIEIVNLARIATISKTKASTLVELSDGESIRVTPIGSLERSPQAITYFVGQTMTGLLSWNALPKPTDDYKIDPTKQLKLDPGILTSKAKITTSAWASGFALSEDFRAPFLEEISNLTPSDVFNGSTQSILKVSLISQPTRIKDGQWKVDMVAEIVVFQGSNLVGKPIAFNKTVFVRAIDTAALPRFASDVQETASMVRKAGLEIYKIQDLDL